MIDSPTILVVVIYFDPLTSLLEWSNQLRTSSTACGFFFCSCLLMLELISNLAHASGIPYNTVSTHYYTWHLNCSPPSSATPLPPHSLSSLMQTVSCYSWLLRSYKPLKFLTKFTTTHNLKLHSYILFWTVTVTDNLNKVHNKSHSQQVLWVLRPVCLSYILFCLVSIVIVWRNCFNHAGFCNQWLHHFYTQ